MRHGILTSLLLFLGLVLGGCGTSTGIEIADSADVVVGQIEDIGLHLGSTSSDGARTRVLIREDGAQCGVVVTVTPTTALRGNTSVDGLRVGRWLWVRTSGSFQGSCPSETAAMEMEMLNG